MCVFVRECESTFNFLLLYLFANYPTTLCKFVSFARECAATCKEAGLHIGTGTFDNLRKLKLN
jgi:hypothetical protein